jgi:diadenylate cyclase
MDYLSLLSSFIRWQDIVDIIFISYILFRLYILFKGTNVFTVLIAILILWFFQKIAFSLGLIVTSWAIQGFTAVAAIIIIVIFRNEIRSVLHQNTE